MSQKDKNKRKRTFSRLQLDNQLLERLFVKYKAQLISATKDQLIVFQNKDKWKIIRLNNEILLYHNNYAVASDGTRYRLEDFHLQQVFQLEDAYKFVTKIVGYNWEKHLEVMSNAVGCSA